jgi:putative membrane protein
MMGTTMVWMWIWPVLVVFGLLILGYVGFRLMQQAAGPPSPSSEPAGSTARRILDQRFARGEIDEEDYRRRREELR